MFADTSYRRAHLSDPLPDALGPDEEKLVQQRLSIMQPAWNNMQASMQTRDLKTIGDAAELLVEAVTHAKAIKFLPKLRLMSEADRDLFTICIDADKLKFDYSWLLRSEDKLSVVEDALESLCSFLDGHLNGAAKKVRDEGFFV